MGVGKTDWRSRWEGMGLETTRIGDVGLHACASSESKQRCNQNGVFWLHIIRDPGEESERGEEEQDADPEQRDGKQGAFGARLRFGLEVGLGSDVHNLSWWRVEGTKDESTVLVKDRQCFPFNESSNIGYTIGVVQIGSITLKRKCSIILV